MLLKSLFRAAARRPTTSSPTAAESGGWWQPFEKAGLIQTSDDGEPASGEGSLSYHAWFRAISLIAQKVAQVPKHLLRRVTTDAGEGKERAREHPVYELVGDRANAEQTAFQFWLQMAGHVPSRGNAYAALWRENGRVTELIPMNPDRTHPVRKDGKLWYVVFPFGHEGDGIRLLPSEVLHFKGWGFDGLCGYPVWAKAKDEIGLARGHQKMQSARYKNSGRPAMLLETDAKLSDPAKQRLREDWERMHVGLNNAGKTAILDNGLKAKTVGMTAEELEQAGAAQMSLVAISNYTGVPVSKLGGSGRSYASQEQEDQAFIGDGLDFWLNVFEDECGAKLLTVEERAAGYEVKANREALLRPAIKDKFEVLRIATAGKPVMTQNEARRQLDLPPAEEPDADRLLTPLNMGQGGKANTPNDNADPGPGRPEGSADARTLPRRDPAARTAAAAALKTSAKKLVKRVAFHAARASKDGAKFMAFLETIRAHRDVFRAEFAPGEAMAEVANANGQQLTGHAADWLLAALEQEFTAVSNDATPKTLESAVAALIADQQVRLPKETVHVFLEADDEA